MLYICCYKYVSDFLHGAAEWCSLVHYEVQIESQTKSLIIYNGCKYEK